MNILSQVSSITETHLNRWIKFLSALMMHSLWKHLQFLSIEYFHGDIQKHTDIELLLKPYSTVN